ncbi:calcium-binding protein, partial [Phaeovulum sp. W22_SRMD_FR3]|uniref:calcium-binding protein n=1 Tax=Phaeovulum sp. W22_SRMD_FR3 TaxID=3240274 RepID=UPI003F9B86A9
NTGHGLDTILNVENLTSGDGNDRLIGNALANTLTAGAGNDVLDGGAGNDLLEGGLGHDGLTGGSGDDTLLGGSGNDALNGGLGNDRIDGGDGIDRAYFTGAAAVSVNLGLTSAQNTGHGLDTILNVENLTSGDGNDRLIGNALANTLTAGAGNDTLNGGAGNDLLEGGTGNDALTGATGNDTLLGGSGNDALNGGLGNDRMTGGAGSDSFVFNTALGAGNSDVIVDFSVTDDSIRLDDAVFQGLALGRLASPAFAANLTGFAEDASDRIIYETDTGRLYFDADGSGAAARVQFATMTAGLALTTADFFVF